MAQQPRKYLDREHRFIGGQAHVQLAWDRAVTAVHRGLTAGYVDTDADSGSVDRHAAWNNGRYAADPQRPFEIVSWLLDPANQARHYVDVGLFPSAPTAFDDPLARRPDPLFGGQITVDVFALAAKDVQPAYFSPQDIDVSNLFTDELVNVEATGKDPGLARRVAIDQPVAAAARCAVTVPGRTTSRKPLRHLPQYLAISPFFVLFAVFGAYPVLYSLYLAFQRGTGSGPAEWVGLSNFEFLVTDLEFWNSIGNTFVIWVMSTVPMTVPALLIAVGLNSSVRFEGLHRIAYFTPNVTSIVAMAIVFGSIFSPEFGILNAFIRWIGLDPVAWLSEAAKVDGAGFFRTFWTVALPIPASRAGVPRDLHVRQHVERLPVAVDRQRGHRQRDPASGAEPAHRPVRRRLQPRHGRYAEGSPPLVDRVPVRGTALHPQHRRGRGERLKGEHVLHRRRVPRKRRPATTFRLHVGRAVAESQRRLAFPPVPHRG
ncbi:carbohydrate ABC transporter permease [Kibdelosporangium phytohabitans]|uniref:carbohydrate ABC transporter permease n=1 Tax=Kibdelosporangium phytohabitans TaxID=860235 RepID=UPI0019D959FC|nr:ABC-type glycerol-3-phosphate transport system permease component [Kibdelosporangium phytohabitans]